MPSNISLPKSRNWKWPDYTRSRNSRLMTLPVVVIGMSSIKATSRGYSCADNRVFTKPWMSDANVSDAAKPFLER
jgi:hypothetical protein